MAVQVRVVLKHDAFICATTWILHERVWLQMEASDLLEASMQQIPTMASLLQLKSLTRPHTVGTKVAFYL